MSLGLLPFMSVGKMLEIQTMMGDVSEGKIDADDLPPNSSGGVMVESLLNVRTVASLTIEEERLKAYQGALNREEAHPIGNTILKGSTFGISQLVQLWGIGLMTWFGGYLLYTFPDKFTFDDMLISMFGLMFGLMGIGIAMADLTDSEKAKAAAKRIFDLIDRESKIDPLTDLGKKLD
jgi:ATP-binding cassette subfamily B (MDR/TAP) protein 1